MKVTINGITFEGTAEEVKQMVEWQEKRMSTVTCSSGSGSGDMTKPYEVSCEAGKEERLDKGMKCRYGRTSCVGCEHLSGTSCHALAYATNPPQYDPCPFCS